jgi:hypothetical protein
LRVVTPHFEASNHSSEHWQRNGEEKGCPTNLDAEDIFFGKATSLGRRRLQDDRLMPIPLHMTRKGLEYDPKPQVL